MNVSIIIVNYNTRQLLLDCLESVIAHTRGCSYEIIVADNGSSDGSLEAVREAFPEVVALDLGSNIGFGRANNAAAKHVGGDYLFLLNSDTLLHDDAVTRLWEYASSHPEAGVVGGCLTDASGAPAMSFGRFPGVAAEIGYLLTRVKGRAFGIPQSREPFEVDFVTGADMMIPRSLYEEMGGFDENIFLYYEETDLQKRIALRGLRRVILPEVGIVHLEGASFGSKGLIYKRFCNSQRSYNYYVRKHFRGPAYLGMRLFLCILRITVLFRSSWTLRERLSAYGLVIKGK